MQEQIWAEQEMLSFTRIRESWNKRLHSDKFKNPNQEILKAIKNDSWQQDKFGNWVLQFPDIFVYDEDGNNLNYEVIVPNDTLPSQHRTLIRDMTKIALGMNMDNEFISRGTRSWAAKFRYGDNWDLVCLYMHEIDITGIDRLTHMNLISLALEMEKSSDFRVPKPIFATTNFMVIPYIDGNASQSITKQLAECKLNRLRDDFLDFELGWDPGIRIDSQPSNYRQVENGKTYIIDPVYRRGKIIF